MSSALLDSLKEKMEKALKSLHHEFSGLRTGRASANMLDPIKVDEATSLYFTICKHCETEAEVQN